MLNEPIWVEAGRETDIRKGSVFKLMLGLCGRYWSEGTRPRRRDKAQETELDIRGKKDARYL